MSLEYRIIEDLSRQLVDIPHPDHGGRRSFADPLGIAAGNFRWH